MRPRPTSPTAAAALVAALLTVAALLLLSACGAAPRGRAATYTNPVIAGQQPDPTILRDGDVFYLATTSRAWAPLFPLHRSRDLVSWERLGGVLERAPAWAAGPFWAPELTRWGGQTRVYYTARLRSHPSRTCVGVALAARPAGPYRDLGRPLSCPPTGAIDPFVATDEQGARALLYRRYRAGGGIWARRLAAGGLALRGPAHELLPATPADDGVVEGPAVVRRGGTFVLLFAAGNCCHPPCDYHEGVAHSRSLLGPYVRVDRRALTGTPALRCPGHGTLVADARGGWFFAHHAVVAADVVNARRATLIEPVRWDAAGWPAIGDRGRPLRRGPSPLGGVQGSPPPLAPDLAAPVLDAAWEWPWNLPAHTRLGRDGLLLRGDPRGAVLARQVAPLDVRAQVRVRAHGCAAGLAGVEGDQDAGVTIGIEQRGGRVRTWRGSTGAGAGRTVATAPVPAAAAPRRAAPAGAAPTVPAAAAPAATAPGATAPADVSAAAGPAEAVTLGVTVSDSRLLRFAVRAGDGRWRTVGPAVATSADQRAIRLALTCRGPRGSSATFGALRIAP